MRIEALRRRSLPLLALVFWLLWITGAAAQTSASAYEPGSELDVSLLTFGPGEIYWERFGHNAIAIRDRRSGAAWSVNYGIFDFEEASFFVNFLRGRMYYTIDAAPMDRDIANYREQGRAVLEQTLRLTPAQRLALRDFLQWNLRPENARYRYEYFSANCSTKVRDALDRVLGGAIKRSLETRSRGYTYRLQADHLLAPVAGLMLPMDLGLGPYADRPLSFWEESFIPAEFARHLALVRVDGAGGESLPLVVETRVLAEAAPALAAADTVWLRRHGPYPLGYALPVAAVSGALCLLLFALARSPRPRAALVFAFAACAFALVAGLGGLLLGALWLLTEHVSAWRNENLLLLDPLLLLLLPALWRTRHTGATPGRVARGLAWLVLLLALAALALKVLPWFAQNNAVWIALLLPPHVLIGWRLLRRDPTP